ncbi:hypothetical protein RRG08_060378 [Elysia crispata]|uniref:Integrase catalytic domain-containing protein n=1 Tax=Elysia crispata TaxID=231223 RepID=A0AAE0ZIE4_9GAST|nr:hypothetical protein RRG08_060378 [Elysia crispata]
MEANLFHRANLKDVQNSEEITKVIEYMTRTGPLTPQEHRRLPKNTLPLLMESKRLRIVDGILVREIHWLGEKLHQVVLPVEKRLQAMELAHDKSEHQGQERTTETLCKRCYWVGMTRDVLEYCVSCQRCQFTKAPAVKAHQPLQHLRARFPLEIVAMDFTQLERAADGREHVLVLTDVFTKWTVAVPVSDQTTKTVVKVVIHKWIYRYGAPHQLHSDQGRWFEAAVVQDL